MFASTELLAAPCVMMTPAGLFGTAWVELADAKPSTLPLITFPELVGSLATAVVDLLPNGVFGESVAATRNNCGMVLVALASRLKLDIDCSDGDEGAAPLVTKTP